MTAIASRRRRVSAVFLGLATLTVTTPSWAAPVFIDFESVAEFEVLTNQFVADGVAFTNVVVLQSGSSLNDIDFPPTSGIHAVTANGSGAIVIDFVLPVNSFSIQITTANDARVEFFDVADMPLPSEEVSPNLGSPSPVSLTGSIGRVQIAEILSGDAFGLTLDDLRFNVVPEPTTLSMVVFGFFGLFAFGWRRGRALVGR
jgi:hypothetical protein